MTAHAEVPVEAYGDRMKVVAVHVENDAGDT
eukprot:SAG31_NODE_5379_length_2575_cov_5.130856_1_plen_31_part_00